MALWVLFTSTVNGSEAIGGVGVSCVVATLAELTRREAAIGFRPRLRWFLRTWRVPVQIVMDTVVVFRALAQHVSGRKRMRGSLRAVPFRHGRADDQQARARRALAIAGVSVPPNSFALGIDEDRDELLVHQLVDDERSIPWLFGRA